MRSAFVIGEIKKWVRIARETYKRWKSGDNIAREALAMALFQIANNIIDAGSERLRKEQLGPPITYRAIFDTLFSIGLITKDDLDTAERFILLRNRIAHRYHIVQDEDIEAAYSAIDKVVPLVEKLLGE